MGRNPDEKVDPSNAVSTAINHPAGVLVEPMSDRLWAKKPQADDGIPQNLATLFGRIAEGSEAKHFLARVILASRLFNLFALDPDWCSKNILSKMDWDTTEDPGLWSGYCWSPRVGPNLEGGERGRGAEGGERGEEGGRGGREGGGGGGGGGRGKEGGGGGEKERGGRE